MKRFREYTQRQPYLLPPSLEEFVKDKDLVRVVDEVVEGIDLKPLIAKYSGGGSPAYHPQMMLKVVVYAYCTKVYSSRQIAKHLKRDLHFMWLAGRQQPDFRTINRFRGEYLKAAMEQVFAQVVTLLIQQGHVKGDDYFVDGTKLEADANRYKVVWRKNTKRYKESVQEKIREILKEVERVNVEEDERYGDDDLPEYGEQSGITSEDVADTVKKINDILRKQPSKSDKKLTRQCRELNKLNERLARYEEQEEKLEERNSYSHTDPDATAMRMKDDTCKPAYNVQAGTEGGFVIGYSVHQDRHDARTLRAHLTRRESLQLPVPKRIVADSAYGSEENYKLLRKHRIESFLKYPSFQADEKGRYKPFARESFVYDKNRDLFICPASRELPFVTAERDTRLNSTATIYQCRSCTGCKFKNQCSPGASPRRVRYSASLERLKKQARKKLTSALGVQLRRRRGNEVESVFGDLKRNQMYSRLRLRGLAKATVECGLLFTSLNIRKVQASR